MRNEKLQILGIIASFIASLLFFISGEWLPTLFALLLGAILLAGRMRFGRVYRALRYLYKGDMKRCEAELQKIKKPENLKGSEKAYYHFCQGYLYSTSSHPNKALEEFERALAAGLKLPNDQAVAHVTRADILIRQNKKNEAQAELEKAEKLRHNKVVEKAIERLKAKL